MGEKMNALYNTASVAPRAAGIVLNTAYDLFGALTSVGFNFADRMGSRARDIKEAIRNANTGPQRRRWYRRPWAYGVGTGSFLTGLVRAGVTSIRDGIGGIFQAIGNTFNNAGSAIMRMGKKEPVGRFSFAKLQPQNVEMRSTILPKRFKNYVPAPAPAPGRAPAPAPGRAPAP